jgi:acetyl esterase
MQRLLRSAIRAAMSSDWLVNAASRKRSQGIDAALDRQVAAALEYQRVRGLTNLAALDPVAARVFAETNVGAAELDPAPMAEVIDITCRATGEAAGRIPVRLFVPHGAGPNWIVWFHGGGGVIGSIAGAEPVTRYLAARTRCTVASVGYRLAPEDPHPAAIDDACAAWEALVQRVPAGGRVAVGGDSFGGFLSIHVDRFARESSVRPSDLQILVYPVVDLTMSSASIDRYAEGYLLTREMMSYFHGHYVGSQDPRGPSPMFWDDGALAGASPAIVVTAGYDPLVDEGNAWAQRLQAAGTPVMHHCYASLVHGFLSLAGVVRAAHAAIDEVCEEIVQILGE